MLKDFVPAERKTIIQYELCFDDGRSCGFGFPCDENGTILNLPPEAEENLAWCRNHPELFERFSVVDKIVQKYTEPAHGKCRCGAEVELFDQYQGACQCPECGRWYNLFGQELLPPDQWEEWE